MLGASTRAHFSQGSGPTSDADSCTLWRCVHELLQTPMAMYWIALAPFIGVICVVTRWRYAENRATLAPYLDAGAALGRGPVGNASHLRGRCQSNDERRWQCACSTDGACTGDLYGRRPYWGMAYLPGRIVLGVGVPAIAWLEQSALLLLLVFVVLVAVIAPFFWHGKWEGKHQPLPSG